MDSQGHCGLGRPVDFPVRIWLDIVLGMIYSARGIGERLIDRSVADAQGRNERAVNDGV